MNSWDTVVKRAAECAFGSKNIATQPNEPGRTRTPYDDNRPRVNGAARALEFYKQAFGARELLRVPGDDGKIAHAQMRIGDSPFFAADEDSRIPNGYRSPQTLSGTSCAIYMYADAMFDQAIRAGAESLSPVADQHWGDREDWCATLSGC